jgi:alanine racemase
VVNELRARYRVPKQVAEEWVETDSLSLLLDGLDEVAAERREDCVHAINAFRQKHGFVRVVVCSRSAEYASLIARLELNGAVVLRPLSDSQIEAFLDLLKELRGRGIDIPKAHMANSGGILAYPESYLTIVRAGIMLYGLYPSGEVEKSIPLTPAMSFVTRVRYLKRVPKGIPISYGRTFVTERETAVATLPVGYADGYPRILSNRRHVLVRGKEAPIIGRVCMDMTMVDVTDIPGVKVGDEAVLFGLQGESEIHIDRMAEWLNTINYEVTCIVGKRVPRVYINE